MLPSETPTRKRSGAPRAVVIGGGATGCAVIRDLALRGFHVTLIERGDLGTGTSSRFHGMLQSGARYAVSDTGYAGECMRERKIIAELLPHAVEPVGGLFVSLEEDPDTYADSFVAGCRGAQIPVEELDPEIVMKREPALSRHVNRAFSVPDATINPWWLVNALADDVRRRGGSILVHHHVTAINKSNGGTIRVAIDGPGGSSVLEADIVVNAAGAWSGHIAALAGQTIELELTKGSIIVLAHRAVGQVINRCRYPTSHDIIVPTGTVSLFGTTSEVVSDANTTTVRSEEIQKLLEGAAPLIPKIRELGFLRAWAGVRPLVKPHGWPTGKAVPRRHRVIDHGEAGFTGLFTVCGGSLTTHRSMAEDVADQICQQFRWNAPCETATIPFEGKSRKFWRPAASFVSAESLASRPQHICECEAVEVTELKAAISSGIVHMHDLRRRLRLGFGPCQGTFCGVRTAELLASANAGSQCDGEFSDFWMERLKGMALIAWGKQARQMLLSEHVHRKLIGLTTESSNMPKPEIS